MIDWIQSHQALVWWTAGITVVTFIGTLIAVPILIVRLPSDYFLAEHRQSIRLPHRHPILGLTLLIFKNGLGVLLLVIGIAFLVLPVGQGILTILVGMTLIDFPGKYKLERWLISWRSINHLFNWMRRKAGRPPLQALHPSEDSP